MTRDPEVHLNTSCEAELPSRSSCKGRVALVERVTLPSAASWEYSACNSRFYLALHDIVLTEGFTKVGGLEQPRCLDLRNQLTFLPPDIKISGFSQATDDRQSYIALFYAADELPESVLRSENLQIPNVYFNSPEVAQLLSRIGRAVQQDRPFLDLLVDSGGALALIELAGAKSFGPHAGHRSFSAAQAQAVHDFMEDNLSKQIALSDLAGVAGMSKFHFLRCYKAFTGVTPYAALVRLRMERAKEMLSQGRPTEEVALILGFKGTAQFYRSFRRVTGSSPGEYR